MKKQRQCQAERETRECSFAPKLISKPAEEGDVDDAEVHERLYRQRDDVRKKIASKQTSQQKEIEACTFRPQLKTRTAPPQAAAAAPLDSKTALAVNKSVARIREAKVRREQIEATLNATKYVETMRTRTRARAMRDAARYVLRAHAGTLMKAIADPRSRGSATCSASPNRCFRPSASAAGARGRAMPKRSWAEVEDSRRLRE